MKSKVVFKLYNKNGIYLVSIFGFNFDIFTSYIVNDEENVVYSDVS